MRVFVTGATGFAGSHIAAELLRHGHRVRLLARKPEELQKNFKKLGFQLDDIVQGDMTDSKAMQKAMQGCDAVVHAAAAVVLDPKRAEETYRNNIDGVKAVVGGACELGIKNIVYVCSMSALLNFDAREVNEETHPSPPPNPYARSKQDADALVRSWQREGKTVQMVYPSAIIGPHDPKLCESNYGLTVFASQTVPRTSSGFQAVDVRDLAAAHRWLLENPPASFENARYIVGGNYYPWAELHHIISSVTGRKIFSPRVPGVVFRVMGRILDAVRKVIPFETPLSYESAQIMTQWVPCSSAKFQQLSGLQFRSGATTFGDAIIGLVEEGHLDRRYAGKLMPA